jgi:uncharacterized coiled-coil DUF342 family protein
MIALLLALGIELTFIEVHPLKLVEMMLSQSRVQQASWLVVALAPLVLLFVALLENEKLRHERKTNNLLGTRLRGVRENLNNLVAGQKESETAINYLTSSDETETINSLQERLSATDNLIELHRQRSEVADVPRRVEALCQHHDTIRNKLGELIVKRRTIEGTLEDLQRSEHDMQHTLTQIEEDKNGNTLEDRIRNLTEFAGSTKARCEQIERCMESLDHHKKHLHALQARVAPLHDEERGVESLFCEVNSSGDLLATTLESLEGNGEGSLFKRVQRLTELKDQFEYRVTRVVEEFTKLDGIHGEFSMLFSKLNQAHQRQARELDANLRIVS